MRQIDFLKIRCLAVVAVILLVMVPVTSCTKTDDTYKNFTNQAGSFRGNALEYLQSQPGVYDSMLLVINRLTGIADTVRNNKITIFAVNNRSFAIALQNINQARMDSIPSMPPVTLSTMDSASLDTFFCRYLIKEPVQSSGLTKYADGLFFPTVRYNYDMHMQYTATNASGFLGGGPKAITFSYPGPNPDTKIFTRYWTRVNTITVDIQTSNALVHLLPPGHDFGFGTEFIRHVNQR